MPGNIGLIDYKKHAAKSRKLSDQSIVGKVVKTTYNNVKNGIVSIANKFPGKSAIRGGKNIRSKYMKRKSTRKRSNKNGLKHACNTSCKTTCTHMNKKGSKKRKGPKKSKKKTKKKSSRKPRKRKSSKKKSKKRRKITKKGKKKTTKKRKKTKRKTKRKLKKSSKKRRRKSKRKQKGGNHGLKNVAEQVIDTNKGVKGFKKGLSQGESLALKDSGEYTKSLQPRQKTNCEKTDEELKKNCIVDRNRSRMIGKTINDCILNKRALCSK